MNDRRYILRDYDVFFYLKLSSDSTFKMFRRQGLQADSIEGTYSETKKHLVLNPIQTKSFVNSIICDDCDSYPKLIVRSVDGDTLHYPELIIYQNGRQTNIGLMKTEKFTYGNKYDSLKINYVGYDPFVLNNIIQNNEKATVYMKDQRAKVAEKTQKVRKRRETLILNPGIKLKLIPE